MEEDVRDEIKRLDGKIDNTSRTLSGDIYNLALGAQKMNVFEQRQTHFESMLTTIISNFHDSTVESKELRKCMGKLSETIATMNGDTAGANRIKRLAWTLFGGLIIAGIIGTATSIVTLREKTVELEAKQAQQERPR